MVFVADDCFAVVEVCEVVDVVVVVCLCEVCVAPSAGVPTDNAATNAAAPPKTRITGWPSR